MTPEVYQFQIPLASATFVATLNVLKSQIKDLQVLGSMTTLAS